MIVEFIGTPGAGKSALARALAGEMGLTVAKISGWTESTSWPERLGSAAGYPRLLMAALRVSGLHGEGLSRGLNLCRRCRQMAKTQVGTVIEDGPLMAACRIMRGREVSLARVGRLVSRIPVPDICVVVETSPEVALHRLRTYRGGNNAALKLPHERAVEQLERHHEAIELVVSVLPESVRVLRINNEADGAVEAGVADLTDVLLRLT